MAKEALLDRVPIPPDQVYRIRGEDNPERAAAEYEATLRSLHDLDLVLLGLGEDGHTASLFPGQPAVHETERWVVAVPGILIAHLILSGESPSLRDPQSGEKRHLRHLRREQSCSAAASTGGTVHAGPTACPGHPPPEWTAHLDDRSSGRQPAPAGTRA